MLHTKTWEICLDSWFNAAKRDIRDLVWSLNEHYRGRKKFDFFFQQTLLSKTWTFYLVFEINISSLELGNLVSPSYGRTMLRTDWPRHAISLEAWCLSHLRYDESHSRYDVCLDFWQRHAVQFKEWLENDILADTQYIVFGWFRP